MSEQLLKEPTIVDGIEAAIIGGLDIIELPLKHIFTPGLYQRIIYIPAGAFLTSRVHRYEHPYVISQGKIVVINELDGTREILQAPYHGVTKPGTRRGLHAITDTIWATFHVTELTDPDEIVEKFTDAPNNPLVKLLWP